MAKLPQYRRILKEDLKGSPDWVDRLLTPINSVFESVFTALAGGLTFVENVRSTIRDVTFKTPSTYISDNEFNQINFASGLKVKATGLQILQIEESTGDKLVDAVMATGWLDNSGQIQVTFMTGLQDSKQYNVRFLVI